MDRFLLGGGNFFDFDGANLHNAHGDGGAGLVCRDEEDGRDG